MTSRQRMVPLIVLLAALMAGPAAAGVTESYPAGSIATRAQAEAAQRAAETEIAGIKHAEAQGRIECQRKILVNDCLAGLRRDSETARRAAHRVELEARDRIRALDAAAASERKAESERQNAQRDAEHDAERARREVQPTQTTPAAAPRITPSQAEANRATSSQRAADLKAKQDAAAARAAEAPAQRAEFEARQAQAQRKAHEAELKKAENQKKRAERAQEREQAAAERAKAESAAPTK